jgi:hypothetical protein
MRLKRRTVVVVILLAGLASVPVVWFCRALSRDPVGPPKGPLPDAFEGPLAEPVSGQFVGHTESAVVERFGPPSHRWRGHYAIPPLEYQLKYHDAVTLTYARPSGVLYLSFCREGGMLVCFSSDWMPNGWEF